MLGIKLCGNEIASILLITIPITKWRRGIKIHDGWLRPCFECQYQNDFMPSYCAYDYKMIHRILIMLAWFDKSYTRRSNLHIRKKHLVQFKLFLIRSLIISPSNLKYKTRLSGQLNCWLLRCSWSIACRRCSNYIFILDLTPGFNMLHKGNCKTRLETFKLGICCALFPAQMANNAANVSIWWRHHV